MTYDDNIMTRNAFCITGDKLREDTGHLLLLISNDVETTSAAIVLAGCSAP